MMRTQEIVAALQRRKDCTLYDSRGPIVGLLRNGRFFAVVIADGRDLPPADQELGKRVLAMRGLFIVARKPEEVSEAIYDALTES